MSQKQVVGNYVTSDFDLKQPMTDVKNLVHSGSTDYKLPTGRSKQLQNTSIFSYSSPRNDPPSHLKRTKVYSIWDENEEGADCFRNAVAAKGMNNANVVAKPTKYVQANEIAIVSDIPPDVALAEKKKVKETLKLFHDLYNQLLDKYEVEGKRRKVTCTPRFDMEAAKRLKKKGKWINTEKRVGHIPGIVVGDKFHFRAELALVGLHSEYISGIDCMLLRGKKIAISVVNSGRYENKSKTVDVLIYSGQGGGMGSGLRKDQKLEHGNLALVNSMKEGHPVRVITRTEDKKGGTFGYTYDGLYIVKRYWQERDCDHKLVFKFELHRKLGQQNLGGLKKIAKRELCVVDDVSHGNENMPIRAMNGVDGERPPTFAYITKMQYPDWCKEIQNRGCNCTNGCPNSRECVCILKSEKGSILMQNRILYECGSYCKCPNSCVNRVCQSGPRYKLELFKTETREWGVRSKSYISSGSFVCEYVGQLQRKQNMGFGFVIDASKVGNVARFIRYSTTPNLFVQRVFYDHGDERMPHIMIFAAKNIPPLHELTWDNNGSMDGDFQIKYLL